MQPGFNVGNFNRHFARWLTIGCTPGIWRWLASKHQDCIQLHCFGQVACFNFAQPQLKVLSHRFFGRFSNCVETTCSVWIMQWCRLVPSAGSVLSWSSLLKLTLCARTFGSLQVICPYLSYVHSREQILLCKQRLTVMYGRRPCLTWASFCSTSISGRSPSEFEAEKEFRAHLPFQSLVLMTSSLFITKLDPCRWPLGWASSI